jgi:hypothetical protein
MRKHQLATVVLAVAGCASPPIVRQEDLSAWVGIPVVALDTHSIFITFPVIRTVTDNGLEIRNYVNKQGISQCFANTNAFGSSTTRAQANQRVGATSAYSLQANTISSVNFSTFQNCSNQIVGCDNIFYIRDGKVLEYRPTGKCYTNGSVQPQAGWERFLAPSTTKN